MPKVLEIRAVVTWGARVERCLERSKTNTPSVLFTILGKIRSSYFESLAIEHNYFPILNASKWAQWRLPKSEKGS